MIEHNCEMCQGIIEEREGAVFHRLERVIIGANPHEGWWRDHLGRRYLCDDCYADHFHRAFDYGAPVYKPRYEARMPDVTRPGWSVGASHEGCKNQKEAP